MNTPHHTAHAAVQAAACLSPMPSACKGCKQAHSALPNIWQHMDVFDRRVLDGQLQFRQRCKLVNAAKKPCLATQPQQPSDPSSNAQAKKAGTQMLIYRRETLLRMLDISKSTLRNWMLEGDFPHPIQLGPRAVGWKAAQVHAWLETRAMVTPGFE